MRDWAWGGRSAPLTLHICICSTTTTEASENQAKLQEQTTQILQSNHAHSVLLRELISRQEEQARALDDIRSTLTSSESRDRPNMSSSGGTGSFTVSTRPSSTGSHPSGYRDSSDNASIMSKRSTLSLRLGRPDYLQDLKASRAYKRLRHFGRGIDSSAESIFSSDSSCSTGRWSMLSDMTLGDLSVSQIAVLNLPIELADVSNPEPFLESSSTETRHHSGPRPRRIWSSRGRIHNAIENSNEFVVKTVLAMGMNVEELDSNGRTPLVHAIMKHQEGICKLLLEKGACTGVEALEAFRSGMDLKERSELLDPLITRALDGGTSSAYVAVLRLLVQMALGTNYGDDNQSSGRSMMNAAIGMGYDLAVRAIIHLEPRVLVEIDAEGRTPLVHATMQRQEAISKLLLGKGARVEPLKAFTSGMDLKERSELLDPLITRALDGGASSVYGAVLRLLVQMALWTHYGDDNRSSGQSMMNAAIDVGYDLAVRAIIHLEPRVLVEIDAEGRTPLVHAIMKRQEAISKLLLQKGASVEPLKAVSITRDASGDKALLTHTAQMLYNLDIHDCGSFEGICEALLGNRSNVDITTVGKMALARIAVSMHDVVNGGYKSILQLLSLIESRDSEGWTPLASAAFNLNEALCEFLVENGCSLCLDTEQKNKLKPTLSRRIHAAARGGQKTALQLLLDMGADINERVSDGETALLEAIYYHHLPCVKILVKKGASATILNIVGYSVLHRAAWGSTEGEMMKFLLDIVETRKLVDIKSSYGRTPLHYCSFSVGQSPIVQLENAKMLLQAGASLTIRNSDGKTPYGVARALGGKELAKYLWSQLSPEQQAQEQPPPSNW